MSRKALSDELGGTEKVSKALVQYLVKKEHEVTMIYFHFADLNDEFERLGEQLLRICLWNPFFLFALARKCVRLNLGSWPIIYAHLPGHPRIAKLLRHLLRARHVHHLHLPFPEFSGSWQTVKKFPIFFADKLITVSKHTREAWNDFGIPRAKIRLIYNGVDVRRFSPTKVEVPDAFRTLIPLLERGFVGRLVTSKGVENLLRAFKRAFDSGNSSLRLVIAGDSHAGSIRHPL